LQKNTLLKLTTSVVFGGIAVFIARGWINTAIESEFERTVNVVEAHAVSAPRMESVVVVNADHSFGDVLTPELLRVVDMPKGTVPSGAYASISDLFTGEEKSTYAIAQISKHEILLPHKITVPGVKGSLSAIVTEGMRAVSVRINDVAGVAGFVTPGDRVDVIYTWDETSRRNGNALKSRILLQNILVLGIDQNMKVDTSSAKVGKTVTLEVRNEDGQKLHLAQDTGRLSLTLRALGDVELEPTKVIQQQHLAGKSNSVSAPKRRSNRPRKASPNPTADIVIFRGEEKAQVSVFNETIESGRTGGT